MDETVTCGQVGGRRNFGYGKRMDWAGINALKQKYRGGHFATVAAHVDHWRLFCRFARAHGVKDSLRVTRTLVESYAEHLAARVRLRPPTRRTSSARSTWCCARCAATGSLR